MNFGSFYKKISLLFFSVIICLISLGQCPSSQVIWDSINNLTKNNLLVESKKLSLLYNLKKISDDCELPKDSVYAKLLSKIGVYEYYVTKNYDSSIKLTILAININNSGVKGSSPKSTISSYTNIGYYLEQLMLYSKALAYHDSAIITAQKFPNTDSQILNSKIQKVYLLFLMGDYQKSMDESTKGISYALKNNDSIFYIKFLNQHAQSSFFQNQLANAESDVNTVISIANTSKSQFEIASAFKTKGLIYEQQKDYFNATQFFKKSIDVRIKTENFSQVASDYNDLGNFCLNSLHNYAEAKTAYNKAIEYAQKEGDMSKLALSYTNLGEFSFNTHDYKDAESYYEKAIRSLVSVNQKNILTNTTNLSASFFNLLGNKDLITVLLVDKGKLFLQLFKETNDKIFLAACLQTAMITDSVITQTRHSQSGEQSKLYWRNKTRDFFTNALEACYLAGDTKNAFYFMEKSRAVLLNDKLNELGANAQLSPADAEKEQSFQIKIITEQQRLSELPADTKAFQDQQFKLLNAKDDFESFTKFLGKKYPAYYEYKYADSVPKLTDLQKQLALNHQSFVHYFMNDTVMYILTITPGNAQISKLSKNEFDISQINRFLQYCSNKSLLNSDYRSFATLSNSVYKTLFQKLQLPKGRVIICSDNFLIPFEALCSDTNGKQFLIYDYTFSYVYSATYLLKDFTTYPAKGNFIGFAPVNFRDYLDVASLSESATALKKSASNYSNTLLFTNEAATKNSFIQKISGYSVVNVFSHASADSTYTEPRIYMQDSVVRLSDLQLLNKPATRLVVLSACQTNVGKNATGEGIYSLARGFASAGIPAVSATLWNADENMIYEVSASFHQYLSKGLSKDSALQKAKIDFINNNKNSGKLLPYYWANMVLIGNAEPLQLSTGFSVWLWAGAAFIVVVTVLVFIAVQRKKQHRK